MYRAYTGCSIAQVLGGITNVEERIKFTVDVLSKYTNISGIGAYVTQLLEVDAFFLNEDRHTNNIAVIRTTNNEYRFAPIFDNGLAVLSDLTDYQIGADVYACMNRVKAKPFSLSFDEQLIAAETLYGNQVKFGFDKKDVKQALSDLSECYSTNFVDRVQDVIFTQMRKYSYLFV